MQKHPDQQLRMQQPNNIACLSFFSLQLLLPAGLKARMGSIASKLVTFGAVRISCWQKLQVSLMTNPMGDDAEPGVEFRGSQLQLHHYTLWVLLYLPVTILLGLLLCGYQATPLPLAASCCASSKSPKSGPQSPGSKVSAYIGMVCETLRNSIPKAVVHCQVLEAKRSLLNHFYTQIGKREGKQLAMFSDEDPAVMERRAACAKRLEFYKQARDEIDSVAWPR
ncbi:hypothetical protein GOP47_0024738 [Adiantum capillus-veneris]|uniref:GED domain-containing protein n=1 Tax=Adiantum capillus-veneris TaxID=13818 RepID=A0A9D4U3J8_ADICA|nr:hypothetical protein GOP47_0024738 [Adiantum capillus-veneris]